MTSAHAWNREYNEQAEEMRAWAKGRRTATIRAKWNGARFNLRSFGDSPRLVATTVVLAEILEQREQREAGR